jgi:hypothetical protein
MVMADQRQVLARGRAVAVGQGAIQWAVLALAVIITVRALYYCSTVLPILRWPFEIHGGESTMLYESQLLNPRDLAGSLRALYGPQQADRFVAGNYPPFYLLFWAFDPGGSSYITGRGLSLLGGIVAALAGGVAVAATVTGGRAWRIGIGCLGGAAFICTVPVFQQLSIAKPDMIAIAFAACGLACFAVLPDRRGAALAGVCCALAGLTKQSVGFATVALLIAALRQHWRVGLTLLLSCGATVLAVLGGIWLVVGPSLFEHLIIYNLRSWRQDRFESLNEKFFMQHWPLLIAALLYAAWAVRARPRSALSYYPITALVVLLMVGSDGAARNYYVELCLAMGLGAALAVGTFLRSRPPIALSLGTAALALVAIHAFRAYTLFVMGLYVPGLPVNDKDPNPVLAQVDAVRDPVLILADNAGYLAMRGRPVVIDDPYLASLMIAEKRWDPSTVITNIAARRYTLVLVNDVTDESLRVTWGNQIIDTLLDNYEPHQDGYVPKKP